MREIQKQTPYGPLRGTYAPDFEPVAAAFEANFVSHGEVGASVCITIEGKTVVDLWGGYKRAPRDDDTQQGAPEPWDAETICVVYSSTKGAVALAAHTLVSAGELELDAPVKKYWPEFAANGKASATVRMMLDHSVGVPCMRETLDPLGCCDWDYMTRKLEEEEPFWKPGTRNGYHMMNFGWTVGELIRRVTGQSMGQYFAEAIAGPTGAECWIGLPETHQARVARIIPYRPPKGAVMGEFTQAVIADRNSIQALALFNNGGFNANDPRCHAAEIGGGGGLANARGLARIYTPFACGGSLNGHQYVDADTLAGMGEVAVATHEDATLLLPTRFGLGFMKSMDNRRSPGVSTDSVILGSAAFGHVGAGGSIGFADPAEHMGFGYVMNRQGPGILLNERGQSLIDAAYRVVGCRDNTPGVWIR